MATRATKPNPFPEVAFTFLGHPLKWISNPTWDGAPCWRWRSCRSSKNSILVRAWPGDKEYPYPVVYVTFFGDDEVEFSGHRNTSAEIDRLLKKAAKLIIERRNILNNVVGDSRW